MFFRYFNLAFGLTTAILNCSPKNSLLKDIQISINPELPKAGDTYSINIQGTPIKKITHKEDSPIVLMMAKLSDFPIAHQVTRLCNDSLPETTKCPLEKDIELNMSWSGAIPEKIRGKLVIHEEWTTSLAETLLCFEIHMIL
jgi:hypothetical protein